MIQACECNGGQQQLKQQERIGVGLCGAPIAGGARWQPGTPQREFS
jgi:hypothetical protein